MEEINGLLRARSIALTESEAQREEFRNRLRQQLGIARKLCRFLDDAENAADRLRSSARWQIANPVATLRTKLSRSNSRNLLGYGYLEKVVLAYSKYREAHPEIAGIEEEIKNLTIPGMINSSPKPAEPILPPGPPEPAVPVESIRFPRHETVEVSVIIPVCNQFQYTHACLAAMHLLPEEGPFEVIIVDDGSTDETADLIPRMNGVLYLRNETNVGFVASCNRGAEKARGKYLMFLNNDTIVKHGWLKNLVETFIAEPNAGIVGSKLVYPDGRLQEAGGIIWRDGTGWNYGKFDYVGKPQYNYLRDVDYCSGAALMVPRDVFSSVGGFDVQYAPGYYEDTDLAFKVRERGYRVLYQPASEIIHYEGITGGTDLSAGAKKHQEINRSTFTARWATELVEKPANGDLSFLQRPLPGKQNILVIDHHLPMPDRDSGSLRMFQILKLLHELGHRVAFIPDNLGDVRPYTSELQRRGIQVWHYPFIKSVGEYLEAHGSMIDTVVLSRCEVARKHISFVRQHAPNARVIFDTVDLHFLREQREADLTGNPQGRQNAKERQKLECELITEANETWVVSDAERELLGKICPISSIEVVSNIVDVPGTKTLFRDRHDFLFVGSFLHPPNIDGVLFFAHQIYPFVRKQLPAAKFYVIGDKAPPEIIALADGNIVVTGLVPDVELWFEKVKLSIAPLRFGAGVKGKINQSMGLGVPVVATTLAVEGMELKNRDDILIADEPEAFAQALVELYQSEELWMRLSENGIKTTRVLYSTDTARKRLQVLLGHEHLRHAVQERPSRQTEIVVAATN
jgi:GT2 family glycosyltransferase